MTFAISRRGTLGGAALLTAAAATAHADGLPASLRVTALKTEQVENPLGVGVHPVRLSWQIQTSRRNTRQSAWRVQAASTREALMDGRADLWDSQRVESDATFGVRYGGPALTSGRRAWWRVQVWDSHGRTAVSDPAFWEMGLLSPADWRAQWLAIENAERRADRETGLLWVSAPEKLAGKTAQFRLGFVLDSPASVTVLSVADADYRAFADGRRLTLPPWQRIAFGTQGTIETTLPLDTGAHTLALSVNAGHNPPRCAIMLRIVHADGRMTRVNGLDARVSADMPDGWEQPGFDDSAWPKVVRVTGYAQPLPESGAYMVRRDFDAGAEVVAARLYVTALGAYETWINGARVGEDLLAPESMDFRRRIRYRVHDVTSMIRDGANAIGAMVGDGWYGSRTAPMGRFAFGEPPLRFLAQLEIRYADGRTQIVGSDDRWTICPAPVTRAEIYNGEHYDARLEQPGWAEPGFVTDSGWLPVHILPPETNAPLEGALSPPIRRIKTLPARTVTEVDGIHIVDFGQNFAGWARIRVKGERGRKITLRFAEVLKADGGIDQSNLREAACTDSYTLRGDPKGETWEPRFTYHGFRYVEVSGLAAPLQKADVTGIVIHSALPETGTLSLGNPLLQQFWRNSCWSQRSNFMGIPTDCPQRDERLGWMGDAHVFWDAAAFNMDLGAFTRRWTADVRDAQYGNGAYAFIAPNSMPDTAPDQASPGWADAGVILPWTAWKRYGDTAVIDENWQAMQGYISFILASSDGYIWTRNRGWDFGDWLALDAKDPGDPTTPKDLIATAMFKHSVDAMIDMAEATGRSAEAAGYRTLRTNIRDAFIRAYVRPDGAVGNESQTGYILALAYGLVPDALKTAAARRLKDNIVARGNLLTTGFLGTPASLDVLADNGFASTVYDLLLRTDYPSWGYMVMKGATTTWERWNSDVGDVTMNSFNHYAFGAVIGFLYRRIAGIEPVAPGFRVFRVNPVFDGRLKTGGADYDSVSGRITTRWVRDGGTLRLDAGVPANTRALIHLPASSADTVREGGRRLNTLPEIRVVRTGPEGIVVDAGSGRYSFQMPG